MTTRCEACGATPAKDRALESCASSSSGGLMDSICVLHSLCQDCYSRYKAMDNSHQERFRSHLTEEGMGIALEI